jgi:predicted metal-binding membrane protein
VRLVRKSPASRRKALAMQQGPDFAGPAAAGVGSLAHRHVGRTAAILAAAVLGWAFLAWIALDMESAVAQLMMPDSPQWSAAAALAVWSMWGVMMAAMMLPSALPMLLVFTDLSLRAGERGRARAFVAAYLLAWCAFSVAATVAQWALQAQGWTDPMATSRSAVLTGGLLVIAGLYQFTPLKTICLAKCRSPLGFLLGEWRPGSRGAFVMGLRHGLFCVGCCWALMALLFVGGVMNLAWIAALSIAVAIEKLAPGGHILAPALGLALVGSGLVKLAMLAA